MKIFGALRLLWAVMRRDAGSEKARYTLSEKLVQVIYPRYKFSEFGRLFLDDSEFLAKYREFEPANDHSLDRKYTVDQLAKLCSGLDGDTAECGVYEGATSYFICRRLVGSGKEHHVFDSFEGLSAPEARDGEAWRSGDLAANEEVVRRNLERFDFVRYYTGWIPSRFEEVADRRFCFVHVDVDLYQPTRDSIEFFYDRMTPGGILVCDDYGFRTCPGAREAMDTFFAERSEEVIQLPTGQAMVVRGPGGARS